MGTDLSPGEQLVLYSLLSTERNEETFASSTSH